MEKTIMNMIRLNLTIFSLFLVVGIGCSQIKESAQDAKILCENMNKETLESFANWEIYKRGEMQDTIIVCDYNGSELSSRFLIIYKSSFLIKSIAPQKDSTFIVLRNYPETLLSDLGIRKEQFELNMKLYRKLDVDKILYRKEFDGLIISKGKVSAIKLLSDKLIDKVPKNYKLLTNGCYYYSE